MTSRFFSAAPHSQEPGSAERPVRVAVCSLFKNSAETIDYYRAVITQQLGALDLRFFFIEGDSGDGSWEALQRWAQVDERVAISKMDVAPFKDFDDRVRKWAKLGNAALAAAASFDYEYLLWCESDLCVPYDLVSELLATKADICAPMVWLGSQFYDTWGFRGLDGRRFEAEAPYHHQARLQHPFEVRSVGSVVLFRRAVLDAGIRFRGSHENGLLIGMCQDARARGFHIFVNPRVSVIHPTTTWRRQQYVCAEVELVGSSEPEWEALAAEIAQFAAELPRFGDLSHPGEARAFAGLRRFIARRFPHASFALGTALYSEHPKRYRIIVKVAQDACDTP